MPLDHADDDRQQHGGNDGCGEDKAVLQGKKEPIGQHHRADQHAAERFELKAAPAILRLPGASFRVLILILITNFFACFSIRSFVIAKFDSSKYDEI